MNTVTDASMELGSYHMCKCMLCLYAHHSKPVPCIEPIAMASKANVPTTALHVAASKGNPNLVLLKLFQTFKLIII